MKRQKIPPSNICDEPRFYPSIPSKGSKSATKNNSCYVEFDGERFYSDRFYLNAPTGLPYYNHEGDNMDRMRNDCASKSENVKFHAPKPPPLFDRARLIQSLDLTAAIVGTYTVDIDWISKEIPSLFPPVELVGTSYPVQEEGEQTESHPYIPTLLLHGHQGLKNELLRKQKQKEKEQINNVITILDDDGRTNDDEIQTLQENSSSTKKRSHECMDSTCRRKKRCKKRKRSSMEEIAKKFGKKVFREPSFNEPVIGENRRSNTQKSILNVVKSKENETIYNFQRKRSFVLMKETIEDKQWKDEVKIFGPSVHVTEVLPQWILPKGAMCIEKKINTACHDERQKDVRKRCMGTYHPKFMLLFEKSGSLIVIVSTGNLTRPRAVDGTWLQRFYPKDLTTATSFQKKKVMKGACDGSDFGHVLADFLQKQTDATEDNAMKPTIFLKKYLGISSLLDMQQRYAFEKASVHLVSTVPGCHPGRFGAQHLNKLSGVGRGRYNRRILYGPQRISDILHKCTHRFNPWLPSKFLSKSDKLVIQTTSFGSKWDTNSFQKLIRQYMSMDERNKAINDMDCDLLKNVDIVWPTKRYMDEIQHEIVQNCKKYEQGENLFEHFTFLSSEGFNTIDETCISRMSKYKNQDHLLPYVVSPHIKSYARTMNRKSLPHPSKPKETCLAWFMLTSACLSRGAQGFAEKEKIFQGVDENSYLNFELGVLFCSRLQGNQETDRLYKSFSGESCSYTSNDDYQNSIHLPIPFEMKSRLYQKFEDIPDFDEDPFLHEITETSAIGKNMRFLPLGMKIRKEHS